MVYFIHHHIVFHACPKNPPAPLIPHTPNPVKSFDNARVVRYILATVFVEKSG
jgi:hypothetical protein